MVERGVETMPTVVEERAGEPAVAGEAESAVPAIEGLIVAHIRDAATGEMSLYVGEREVVYKDLPLVQQLARAAHR